MTKGRNKEGKEKKGEKRGEKKKEEEEEDGNDVATSMDCDILVHFRVGFTSSLYVMSKRTVWKLEGSRREGFQRLLPYDRGEPAASYR